MSGRWTGTSAVGASSLGRWLMLLVSLAGLMAMHGFSDHGVGGATGTAGVSVTSAMHAALVASGVEDGDDAAGHGRHAAGSDRPARGPVDAAAPEGRAHGGGHGEGPGGHGGMAELCLAVLAALLLVAALRRGLQPLGVLLIRRLDVAGAARLRARARGPAAPDLRSLSILRC